MTKEGMAYLVYKSGECVAARRYRTVLERTHIITTWKMLYAASFNNCYIHISPITNTQLVNSDGTNKYQRQKQKL